MEHIAEIHTDPALLERLVDAARNYKMTPREAAEQRVSFVYGMLSSRSPLTKADVRRMLRERGLDLPDGEP